MPENMLQIFYEASNGRNSPAHLANAHLVSLHSQFLSAFQQFFFYARGKE
jgi:hypothetical protein